MSLQKTLRPDALIEPMEIAAWLMTRPEGANVTDIMRATRCTTIECRTLIREIIDAGGDVEMRNAPGDADTQIYEGHCQLAEASWCV